VSDVRTFVVAYEISATMTTTDPDADLADLAASVEIVLADALPAKVAVRRMRNRTAWL
jgi:hypothetical protein